MNGLLVAKRTVSLLVFFCVQVFAFMAFAAEPGENQCALWEFETPTDSLTGELVRVTNDPLISSDIIFDLDTSDTIAVPGAVVTTSVSPTSLWGASLPASISANYFSLLKTDDNPITPLIDESDSWTVITPYTNLTFTVLVGFYFEAEMQGYAYHLVPSNPPATQAVLEPFTLSIRGWLPSDTTTTTSDFAYCDFRDDTPCEKLAFPTMNTAVLIVRHQFDPV